MLTLAMAVSLYMRVIRLMTSTKWLSLASEFRFLINFSHSAKVAFKF